MILAQAAVDLVKLLPDGANVIAVIVVVMLFLKQQEKFNLILKNITEDFHAQIKDNQKSFQEQVSQMSGQYFINQKLYQEQIQRLMDGQITVTREVITTLQEVKQNVKGINDKMQRYEELDQIRGQSQLPSTRKKVEG